jgi:superfamily II DNA or RNA helicase
MKTLIDYKNISKKTLQETFADIKFKTSPMHHQLVSLAFALDMNRKRVVFVHDIGTGKTLVALYTAMLWGCKKILVVCPNSTLKKTWAPQVIEHTDFSHAVLTGSTVERLEILKKKKDIYIVNYEGLMYLYSTKVNKKGKKTHKVDRKKMIHDFDCIIIDEVHKLKSHNSLRTKILRRLSEKTEFIIGLTGTPIGKKELDLWAEYWVIDLGNLLGNSFIMFRNIYFKPTWYDWKIKDDVTKEKLLQRVSPITLRYDREECFDLPPRLPYQVRSISPTDEQCFLMNGIIEGKELEYRNNLIPPYDALQKGMRLAQITGGFVTTFDKDSGEKNVLRFKSNPKLDLLLECLEEINDKVIIIHRFVEEGRIIEEGLRKEKYTFRSLRGEIKDKDQEYFDFINKSEIKCLIANQQCGGEGLDKLICSSTMIFYSNERSALLRKQTEGRIDRKFQTKRCLFIDLTLEDSIDEVIANNLKKGKDTIDEELRYIREFKYYREATVSD